MTKRKTILSGLEIPMPAEAGSIFEALGVGSISDFVDKIVAMLVAPFKEAADLAQAVADESDRQLAATREFLALRRTDGQNLAELKRQLAEAQRDFNDLEKLAKSKVQVVSATADVGDLPTVSEQDRGLTSDETLKKAALDTQMKQLGAKIQRAENGLDTQIDAVRAQLSDDEKIAQKAKRLQALVGYGTRPFTQAEADAGLAQFKQSLAARTQHEKEQVEQEKRRQELAVERQKKAEADQAAAQQREAEKQQAENLKAEQLKQDNGAVHEAVDRAKKEVAGYDQQIALDDKDPALTDQEKNQRRVENLDKQTEAIERLTKSLKDYKSVQPELDKANQDALDATIKGLEEKKKKNAVDRQSPSTRTQANDKALRDLNDPARHYQTAGEGLAGGIASWVADMGTLGDQMAASIKNTLGSAVKGITSELLKWDGTGKGALRAIGNIGQMIFRGMIEQIVQMAVQWGVTQLLIKTGLVSTHVLGETLKGAEAASTVAKEGIKTPVLATNAGLASVSSFGVAAILGIALLIAGIAALAFDTGGYTPGGDRQKPVGIVHAGEWVAPQWLVNHPVYGPQIAVLEGARTGGRGYNFGGFVNDLAFAPAAAMTRPGYAPAGRGDGGEGIAGNGAGHRPVNVYPLMADDRGSIERAQRDPYSDARFVHMLKKHRRVLGVKG